ncbi:MAG: TonB-dependent receptor plug domain-containing protein, partial [Myxococcales bacterium]|nr:TonB-dependent receptor plug domain-containing protein [Myxococcales bacterium]
MARYPKTTARICSLAALAMLVPTLAWADPKDDARRHFAAGLEAANDGDYEIALQHFLAAQNAYAHPATLFNIARAYSDMDDLENALSYYRLYQDAAPEKAGEVQATIDAIEGRMGRGPVVAQQPATGAEGQQVVVAGASEAELERLKAIARELEELSRAMAQGRTTVVVGATGELEAIGPDGTALPSAGFISDAYEKQVVTASRVGQDPLDSPSTISVVTAEDLRLSGAVSLPDALRRVAGIDVMSLTSGHQDVSIRGFNRELNNKVLVLIDGRSTYLDFLGATLWSGLPITLEEI